MAALFIVAKSKKQPKCSPKVDWIIKLWYNHTMRYYTITSTWMNLKNKMLSKEAMKD